MAVWRWETPSAGIWTNESLLKETGGRRQKKPEGFASFFSNLPGKALGFFRVLRPAGDWTNAVRRGYRLGMSGDGTRASRDTHMHVRCLGVVGLPVLHSFSLARVEGSALTR